MKPLANTPIAWIWGLVAITVSATLAIIGNAGIIEPEDWPVIPIGPFVLNPFNIFLLFALLYFAFDNLREHYYATRHNKAKDRRFITYNSISICSIAYVMQLRSIIWLLE